MEVKTQAWNPKYAGLNGRIIYQNKKGDTEVLLENGVIIGYKHNLACHGYERHHIDSHGRKVSERYEPSCLSVETLHKFKPEFVETELKSGGKVVLDRSGEEPFVYVIDKNGNIIV